MSLLPTTNSKAGRLLIVTAILQCVVYGVVFLDIPIARQVVGFLYLTFIPGIIILRLLKLDNLDFAEEILFSAGLSIAFSMLLGLSTNLLYPLIGVLKPLSLGPFLLTTTLLLLLFCLVNYFREMGSDKFTGYSRDNMVFFHPFLLLVLFLPLMGLIGTIMVNNHQGNFILLSVIVIISALISLSALSERLIPSRFYPLALFVIILALLCFVNASLVTRYIVGWDIHNEFHAFELVKDSGCWSTPLSFELQVRKALGTASATILPTVYSLILGLDGTWIFKIIFPFLTAFVSLAVYHIYCTQTGKKMAFLATFFFVSISMSYGWGSDKQIVAQLFYSLLFLVIFKRRLSPLERNILFIVFSSALVVSHYALSYIFVFTIFFTWVSLFLTKKIPNQKISLAFVTLFFVLSFSWYIFTRSGVSFNLLVDDFRTIGANFFTDLFNPQTRGEEVLSAFGATSAVSLLHQIGRFFFYITEALIVVGFVRCVPMLVTKRKEMDFDLEYIVLTCANMGFLLMGIVIPNLAESLLMERFYQTALIIAAPLCILGGNTVFGYLLRLKTKHWRSAGRNVTFATIITLGVLVPNFLFQIGFVYEVSRDENWSIPLSSYRLKNRIWLYDNIVSEQEVLGAKWLSNHVNIMNVLVYADHTSKHHVLLSYGMISTEHVKILSNATETIANGAFVYLRYLNVIDGKMTLGSMPPWNTSEIHTFLENQNKIYSNGGCNIYKGLPLNETTAT